MKDKKLNDIPESGNIIDETAFCEKVHESIEEEGRYYLELNEQLKKDPRYQLTPEKQYAMEKRLEHPYLRLGRSRVHSYRRLNKVTLCILVLLILLIAGVMSVSSLRDYTINFLLGLDQTHGDVHVMDGILLKTDGYAPTVLPEGYSFSSLQTIDNSTMLMFSNKESDMLILIQEQIDSSSTIDTENSDVKEVTINGYDGRLSIGADGQSYLIWKTDEYLFTLSCSDNTIDLIPIAESVSKTK